jgi:hypothetical protein
MAPFRARRSAGQQRVLDSPFVLLAREGPRLQRRSRRWGLTRVTAFWSTIEALREVRDAMSPA